MRRSVYPKLAWEGLRKNRQLSLPYLMTCVCMVAMHYILAFLSSPTVGALIPHGSDTVTTVMMFGSIVALVFSTIFLFYTYSFLNRRRAKEFGLYNVLGMGKRSLARIVLWEGLITACAALAGGLTLGVALSKLAELGLMNLTGGEIDYRLRFDMMSLIKTIVCFSLIFALNALSAVIRASKCSAVNLMKAGSVGEKPPKGNWLLAALGFGVLAAAYALALGVRNGTEALMWFFVAVLMVIVATYILMIAGSVWLCRMLQRNRDYYYKPNHFVSVSSMAYRMKRNGAGLASICIIATMVLVILSTTTCLWFGVDDAILSRAPREINLTLRLNTVDQLNDANLDRFRDAAAACAEENGAQVENPLDERYIYLAGVLKGSEIQCDHEAGGGLGAVGALREVFLVSEADYAALTGEELSLAEDEAALLTDRCAYGGDTLTLAMDDARNAYRVASVEKGVLVGMVSATTPSITVIVPDPAEAIRGFRDADSAGNATLLIQWRAGFDTGLGDDGNLAFERALEQRLEAIPHTVSDEVGWRSLTVSSRAIESIDFHASYAGFLFIGIVLSAVFLMAAVLIVYYKQVSEGYEDANRFDIMRKVGMTKAMIRRSIASQLLVVFALPLAAAGTHLAFAFPMIRKVLAMMGLTNMVLFARTTAVSFAVFALFYWILYRLTSGVYYRVVSGAKAA